MLLTILGLIALGALLLVLETFVPGLIVGAAGILSLIAAAALTYWHYGTTAGHTLLFCLLLAAGGFFLWWLQYVPRSWFGRRCTLNEVVGGHAEAPQASLHDATGPALTPLRPVGTASLGGRRVDVVAEGDLIEAGENVRVVRVDGTRVVVRRVEA
jgi:membrane-bound serine protease (ClpP class)